MYLGDKIKFFIIFIFFFHFNYSIQDSSPEWAFALISKQYNFNCAGRGRCGYLSSIHPPTPNSGSLFYWLGLAPANGSQIWLHIRITWRASLKPSLSYSCWIGIFRVGGNSNLPYAESRLSKPSEDSHPLATVIGSEMGSGLRPKPISTWWGEWQGGNMGSQKE